MARYVADQNKTVFIIESGTYANTSGPGIWPGLVTSHDITKTFNTQAIRYEGALSRNSNMFVDGAEDNEGTLTMHPQDWRLLGYALGSMVDSGSPSPFIHTLNEVDSSNKWAYTSGTMNPFASFTLEESQGAFDGAAGKNFIRTMKGCIVNSYDFKVEQGGIAEVTVNYISQQNIYSSGAATAVTEITTRPFVWQDFKFHLPSGTIVQGVKSLNFSVNNNVERRNYLNGSIVTDVPVPLNREYSLNVTLDGNSEQTKTWYVNNFQSGAVFNCAIECVDLSAGAGSRDAFIVFSGCRLMPVNVPDSNEGTNEQELVIMPKSCAGNVNDLNTNYNPF
jgi:hypothetical protein